MFNNTAGNAKTDNMIMILYGLMFLFVCYQAFKSFRDRRKVRGNVKVFAQKRRNANIIMSVLMVVLGILTQDAIMTTIMITIGIFFTWQSYETILLGDTGIYAHARFDTWDKVLKWGWDQEKAVLEMKIEKGPRQAEYRAIQAQHGDMLEINEIIRGHVLNKGKYKRS